MSTECAIHRAVLYAGGQSNLAREIGLKPQAVQRWCKSGKVPAERVLDVERVVAARVTRYELRPDLYPQEAK